MTAFGAYRFDKKDLGVGKYLRVNVDSENFSTGLNSTDVTVLGNTVIRLRNAYSFDAGLRWYYMTNTTDVGNPSAFHYADNGNVYARREKPAQWHPASYWL